jgi:hypothetical protein
MCGSSTSLFIVCFEKKCANILSPPSILTRLSPPDICAPLTQLHLSMYAFVGKLLGMSIRGKHALNLDWPSAVWKLLVGGAAAAGTAASSASSSSSSADLTTESDASVASANGKNAASPSESSSSSSSSPSSPNALSTFTVATVSTLDRADLEGCDVLCMTALNKISGLEAEFSGSGSNGSGSGDATTSSLSASSASASASSSASASASSSASASASSSASASAADADDRSEPTEDAVTRASRALDELGYTFTTVSVDGRVVELVPGGARIRFAFILSAQRMEFSHLDTKPQCSLA